MDEIPDVKVRKVDKKEVRELVNYLGKDLTYNEKYLPWMNACFNRDNLDSLKIDSNQIRDDNNMNVYQDALLQFNFQFPNEKGPSWPLNEVKSYILGRKPETQFAGKVVVKRQNKIGKPEERNTGLTCTREFSRDQLGIYKDEEGDINITNFGLADIRLEAKYQGEKNYSIGI